MLKASWLTVKTRCPSIHQTHSLPSQLSHQLQSQETASRSSRPSQNHLIDSGLAIWGFPVLSTKEITFLTTPPVVGLVPLFEDGNF